LIDLNATRAAIRAGYKARNAGKVGPELLGKTRISRAIAVAMAARSERTEVSADQIVRELARVAFFDPRKLFTEGGALRPIAALDADTAAAVVSLEVFEEFAGRGEEREMVGFTKKLRLCDKVAALKLLGQHLAMFTERQQVTHSEQSRVTLYLPYNPRRAHQPGEPVARETADGEIVHDDGSPAGGGIFIPATDPDPDESPTDHGPTE
jgi:phage terminase small subunit